MKVVIRKCRTNINVTKSTLHIDSRPEANVIHCRCTVTVADADPKRRADLVTTIDLPFMPRPGDRIDVRGLRLTVSTSYYDADRGLAAVEFQEASHLPGRFGGADLAGAMDAYRALGWALEGEPSTN